MTSNFYLRLNVRKGFWECKRGACLKVDGEPKKTLRKGPNRLQYFAFKSDILCLNILTQCFQIFFFEFLSEKIKNDSEGTRTLGLFFRFLRLWLNVNTISLLWFNAFKICHRYKLLVDKRCMSSAFIFREFPKLVISVAIYNGLRLLMVKWMKWLTMPEGKNKLLNLGRLSSFIRSYLVDILIL